MKNSFFNLFKLETILLKRNGILSVSLMVTILYVLVFKNLNLQDMKYGRGLLITIIFNDPAILGFLFTGVMVLFEKNQNTYQALSVVPFEIKYYLLARATLLSIVSMICSYTMLLFSDLTNVNFWMFGTAVLTCALTFSFIGFWVVAKQKSFNTYFLRAIGMVIVLSIPIIALFDLVDSNWFFVFPTQASLYLFELSFIETVDKFDLIWKLLYALIWVYISYRLALKAIIQSLENA
jgi:fluoroquinolone transport system permease protein